MKIRVRSPLRKPKCTSRECLSKPRPLRVHDDLVVIITHIVIEE